MSYHRLLQRQLQQCFGNINVVPKEWSGFLELVERAYREAEEDRGMLERSLDLSSHELSQANSEMRAVVQAFPDIFFRLDLEGVIRDCKGGSASEFYIPPEKLVGKRIQDIPLGGVGIQFDDAIRELRKGKSIISLEYSLKVLNREEFYEARLLIAYEKEILVIVRNITERKQLEEQLRQSQKMEAVGQLAGGIAHDFNNLLTVISGYTQLLLDTENLSDSQRHSVLQVEQASERASLLTNQLLAFSRRQDLQPQVLSLNTIVANIEPMLRRLLGEGIEVVTVLAPDLALVKIDPGQMDQVIMNLAVNACDAMLQGGCFTIETVNVELAETAVRKHNISQTGRYVMMAVSDTGCGMDADTQARIFEPFFTTKGPGKGTGLGLSTVFGIIKQSGGGIVVDSEPGRGARFTIYLPRVEETAAETRVGLAAAKPSVGSETILLVEDEELVRRLNQIVLQTRGYTVLEASNGRVALDISQTYAGPIHLLVTDVVMPDVTGWELARRLAPLRPTMKVLYMSGYTATTIGSRNILDPDIAFLQKPFKPIDLARKVREVLNGPNIQNQ